VLRGADAKRGENERQNGGQTRGRYEVRGGRVHPRRGRLAEIPPGYGGRKQAGTTSEIKTNN